MEPTRLNKYCSICGACSRREADALIAEGRITVNGVPAVAGQKVTEADVVCIDGRSIGTKEEIVVLAFYKPRGIVCTTSDKDRAENVVDFLHYPVRVYPVGRLDKDSEGLLLMTNDGELTNHILKARYYHEKEYVVTVDRTVDDEFVRKMGSGVPILDTVTRPCKVRRVNAHTFSIILTQGLNRQIRRMCEYFGYEVQTLKRVRILNIELEGLKAGEYRKIEGEELQELYRLAQTERKEE